MKDFYAVFNISYQASIVDICQAYQNRCMANPAMVFYYTYIFKILAVKKYKLVYDAMLWQTDIRLLFQLENFDLNEEEEYELANIIFWIEDFREYFYDTKYFTSDFHYRQQLEKWYDELESILGHLKSSIQTFYLS